MRFLIGICTGAVFTLFIATAVDAPTNPVLDRAIGQLETVWNQLIDATSDSLFQGQSLVNQADDPDAADGANPDLTSLLPSGLDDATNTFTEVNAFSEVNAFAEVVEAVSENVAEVAEDVAEVAEDVAEVAEDVAEAAEDVAEIAEDVALFTEPLPDLAAAPDSGPEPGFDSVDWQVPANAPANAPAAIWEPFHSQRSAEGFAERLSRELEHPLRVQREGPGSYQVVFDAQSSIERAELLIQIAEITGQ